MRLSLFMKITAEKFRQALSELKKVRKEFHEFDVLAAVESGDMWEHLTEQQKEEVRKQCRGSISYHGGWANSQAQAACLKNGGSLSLGKGQKRISNDVLHPSRPNICPHFSKYRNKT